MAEGTKPSGWNCDGSGNAPQKLSIPMEQGKRWQFAEPLSSHLLGLQPVADAGKAGVPPPPGFEVVLPELHLQVTAQSGVILLNWFCSFLC